MEKILSKMLFIVALGYSAYNFYAAGFWPLSSVHHSAIALGCSLFLCFMTKPLYKNINKTINNVINIVLAILGFFISIYIIIHYRDIITSYRFANDFQYYIAIALFLLILEATRRTVGFSLPILVFVMYVYALSGPSLPAPFTHPGFSNQQIFKSLFLTMQGYWGTISNATITVVPIFIIFGSLLLVTKGGEVFIKISKVIAGNTIGGAAKIAVIASAFFGTISGATVANCAATGSITIPMMKKLNYKDYFAAAVEAVASSGGQIMPPVMGAGAFIMADILGIPYINVMKAALLPAILFFVSVFSSVHFISIKDGLGKPKRDKFSREDYYRLPLVIIPVFVLLYFLTRMSRSAPYSAYAGSLSLLIYFVIVNTEMKPKRFVSSIINNISVLVDGFVDAAYDMLAIVFIGFAAQILVFLINFTGFGLVFSQLIISTAKTSLFLSLLMTSITTIILGMGLPTVAAYLLGSAILVPTLVKLGIVPLAAHLFVFYYASLAAITPPVCPAVFVTAGIADSNLMKTAICSIKLGIVAFIVPFMFIYSQTLLLEGEILTVMISVITAIMGCIILSGSIAGYLFFDLNNWQRIILFILSIILIYPNIFLSIISSIIIGIALFTFYINHKRYDTVVK
jgi:TRAP transporter 4TM/12TM fusion protein